ISKGTAVGLTSVAAVFQIVRLNCTARSKTACSSLSQHSKLVSAAFSHCRTSVSSRSSSSEKTRYVFPGTLFVTCSIGLKTPSTYVGLMLIQPWFSTTGGERQNAHPDRHAAAWTESA